MVTAQTSLLPKESRFRKTTIVSGQSQTQSVQLWLDVQDVAWKLQVLVAQLCPTLCDPMDYSLPGSSVHGILQARILEWVAIPFSRGSSQPRDRTWFSCIAGGFFTVWATRAAQKLPNYQVFETKWALWTRHVVRNAETGVSPRWISVRTDPQGTCISCPSKWKKYQDSSHLFFFFSFLFIFLFFFFSLIN